MSTFEIKLGETAYPLVIGDAGSCLKVTFSDKAYTFGAELLEVQEYGADLVVNVVYDKKLAELAGSLSAVMAELGFSPKLVSADSVNEDIADELFYGYVVSLQADPSELVGERLDALFKADDMDELIMYVDAEGESAKSAFCTALWGLFDLIDGALIGY